MVKIRGRPSAPLTAYARFYHAYQLDLPWARDRFSIADWDSLVRTEY